MKKGDTIFTPFGEGKVVLYRETDGVHVVQLSFATLYANAASIQPQEPPSNQGSQVMELNVAYEALEAMRKLNLEVECQQRGIPCVQQYCTTCLLTSKSPKKRFSCIQKLVDHHVTSKICNTTTTTTTCWSCGSPVCSTHSSSQFRKEHIVVCTSCEKLFTLDFVVECMTASDDVRRRGMYHMVDIYDRILLLLTYSSQFMKEVAASLQESTVVQNKVGIGSSSAGIVSGVLGVAAAATILTPAGPPLLIASLFFGGSATAVQTGTEVRNYYSEANRLADRVLTLHGMLQNILKVTSTLRDALLRDHLRTDGVEMKRHDSLEPVYEKHKGSLLAGLTVGRCGAASIEISALATAAEVGAVTGRSARFISRSGTNIMRTARFARFAGGALSAATLLFETKCMSDTIQNIRAGNPCEKAKLLQTIEAELPDLPSTSSLERELQNYLQGLAQRERRMTEEECVRLILDASQLQDYDEDGSIVFVEKQDSSDTSSTVQSEQDDPSISFSNTESLLERIERFKHTKSDDYDVPHYDTSPSNKVSLIERISMYKNKRDSSAGMATTNDEHFPVATLG